MYAYRTYYDAAPEDRCAAGHHTWAIFDWPERYPATAIPEALRDGSRLGRCAACGTERLFPPGGLLARSEWEDLERTRGMLRAAPPP